MQLLYLSDHGEDGWLTSALRQMNHVVEALDWDEAAAACAEAEGYDLLVADMASPDPARAGRLLAEAPPSLVVVDHAEASERAALLRSGADACLVRPLHLMEVESRLQALGRMSDRTRLVRAARAGLRFDRARRAVELDGRRTALSPQEYRLFVYLFRRQGEVVDIERLDRHLHGEAAEPRPDQVRAMLTRLRGKLRAALGRELISNLRGHGHVLRLGE